MSKAEREVQAGQFAYDQLRNPFHEKARLGVMTSLCSVEAGLSFKDLKTLCALSDGNLNRHLKVLEELQYVQIEKSGAGRNAKTVVTVTPDGKQAFLVYLSELEKVLAQARAASEFAVPGPERLRPQVDG